MPAPKKTTSATSATKTKTTNAKATQSAYSNDNSNVAVAELPTQTKATQQNKSLSTTAQNQNQNNAQNNNQQNQQNNNTTKTTNGQTQVVAQVDVGYGSSLYIRGQGAGLSWTKGQTMQWQNGSWTWNTNSKENFEFKTLLNDQAWQQGNNMTAQAGHKTTFKPQY